MVLIILVGQTWYGVKKSRLKKQKILHVRKLFSMVFKHAMLPFSVEYLFKDVCTINSFGWHN